jgi:pimeloyl-ACP methyl ester carboxylesterase
MARGRMLVALAAAAACTLAAPAAADAQLRLRDCEGVQCGRLAVPLDRTGATPGHVSLYVEKRGAMRRPRRGVTLLFAGGPGQPATLAYRSGLGGGPYGEFRALTPRNDIVAFDGRGTGRSGLLRCPALERASLIDAGAEAAACARRLGSRRGFYRTSDSVEDVEALRAALGVEKLTLIGVSYGTFLAQAYAARYPDRVERVLLDSVLDVSGWDPLYRDIFKAIPRVLRAVCRSGCSSFTRDPVGDVGRLVARLAQNPLRGGVTLPSGRRERSALTRQELFFTLVSGDLDDILRAQFPAAVSSALRGDSAPLLRLKRQAILSEGAGTPREFSSGLYAATTCEEIPFPWTRFSEPASRFTSIWLAASQIPAAELYPFDTATTAGNDFMRMCRRWPEASPGPYQAPPPGVLPDVPVLMLDGELDLRTPLEGAQGAAADWPHAQVVAVPNTGHSALSADFSGCVQRATRRFFRGGTAPARCRRGEALFPTLPPAPRGLRDLRPAPRLRGARGRTVSAVELTLLDVTISLASASLTGPSAKLRGGGLRGGRWSVNLQADPPVLRLRRVEYVPGVHVSGAVRRFGGRREEAHLRVTGRGAPNGVLRITREGITGRLGGKPVRVELRRDRARAARPTFDSRAALRAVKRRLRHAPVAR